MGQFMPPQITIPSENFFALVALVRLVIGVRQQVGLQVGPLVEAPAADWTLVRGFLHVQDLVDGERSRLAKALPAFAALERFLLRMDVTVISKVVLPTERLAAQVARVRSLVSVSALVNEEVVRLGELTSAKFTDELLLGTRS